MRRQSMTDPPRRTRRSVSRSPSDHSSQVRGDVLRITAQRRRYSRLVRRANRSDGGGRLQGAAQGRQDCESGPASQEEGVGLDAEREPFHEWLPEDLRAPESERPRLARAARRETRSGTAPQGDLALGIELVEAGTAGEPRPETRLIAGSAQRRVLQRSRDPRLEGDLLGHAETEIEPDLGSGTH